MTGLKKLLSVKATEKRGALPSAYQRVEYIKSTGTQHIILTNTFYTGKKFLLDCQSDSTTSTMVIFGYGAAAGYWFGTASGKYSVTNGEFNNVSITDRIQAELTYTETLLSVSINGISRSSTLAGTRRSLSLCAGEGGSAWYGSTVKIFGLRSDGIYDLIPCYRKSDGEIGMYNTVDGVFFTNSGTGEFIKGPDV